MTDLSQLSDDQLATIAGIPPGGIDAAILQQESGGKTNTPQSIDGAIGPSQIMPATFARFAKPGEDIHNPDDNLAVGQRYRDYLAQRFGDDPSRIAVAYFSGEGNVAGPGSPTPWIKDKADGNGKSVSSYVSDVMKRMNPVSEANASETTTPPQFDLSTLSDDQLERIANASPATQPAQGSIVGTAKKVLDYIGQSPVGETVGSGINSAQGAMGNIANLFGANVKDTTPTPDLDALRAKGWSGTSTPQKLGAIEEALFNSPAGKVFGTGILTPIGEAGGTVVNAANAGLEKIGVPHQVSQAVEMALPFLPKAGEILPKGDIGTDLPGILGDTKGGGFKFPDQLPAVTDLLENQASGTPETLPTPPRPIAPATILTTDSGNPLLVTPAAIRQAQSDIQPFIESDGINLYKVADDLEKAQQTNPNVRAIDVMAKDESGIPGGNNILGLAKAIAQTPGQGRTIAAEMANRGFTASQRIGQAFDQSLSSKDFYQTAEVLDNQMKDAGAAYEKAYANPVPITSPALTKELLKPAAQTALEKASQLASNENGVEIVRDGALTTQGVDYMKRALDDMIEPLKRQGENNQVRILTGIKNKIVNEADTLNPDYAAARKAYGDPASVNEALHQGRDFLKMDAEEIKAFMADKQTTQAEKMAFATGARRALQDAVDRKNETTNPINALWKPDLQKRLKAVFDDPAAYDSFASNMEHEKTMARVNGKLQGGSDTVEKATFNQQPPSGLVGKTLRLVGNTMEPGMMLSKLGDFADKALAKQSQSISQDSKTVIMRYLTTRDPEALRDLAQRIGQKPTIKNKP